jgi:hypothetical protein
MKTLLLAGIAVLSISSASAFTVSPYSFYKCALVVNSEDGGDALDIYEKPNAKSKRVDDGSVVVGDTITIDKHPTLDFERWSYMSGTVSREEGYGEGPRGWVKKKNLKLTDCPDADPKPNPQSPLPPPILNVPGEK